MAFEDSISHLQSALHPLSVGKARTFNTAPKGKKRKINHVEGYGVDDTPKAFQRLIAFSKGGAKRRSGLDDGTLKSKKQKKAEQKHTTGDVEQDKNVGDVEEQAVQKNAELKIQPGESMAEFRARVDQALPLSGVSKSGKKVTGVSDHRVTKHERKLKRLQKGWREEEARIREKEMEERELAEEDQDEFNAMWEDKTSDLAPTQKKKKKKTKKRLVAGEIDNNSDDEWEALERKREVRKGLHDVVSAPPTFDKIPREIFKVKNGAGAKVGNVPNAAGSLRKREELGEERKTIIETYRELMAAKRGT